MNLGLEYSEKTHFGNLLTCSGNPNSGLGIYTGRGQKSKSREYLGRKYERVV